MNTPFKHNLLELLLTILVADVTMSLDAVSAIGREAAIFREGVSTKREGTCDKHLLERCLSCIIHPCFTWQTPDLLLLSPRCSLLFGGNRGEMFLEHLVRYPS